MFLQQHGFLRKCKRYYAYGLISLAFLFVLQPQDYFVIIINNSDRPSSMQTPDLSRSRALTARCEQSNSSNSTIVSNTSRNWMRTYSWLSSPLFPVPSKSLLYCAVPKVASKTLISLIIYVYVRDVIDQLKNNRTESRTRAEQLINIPKLIDQLRKNGVPIFEIGAALSIPSLLETYLHVLRFESVNDTSPSLFFNPWRLNLKEIFPAIHFSSSSNITQLLSPSFTRILFVRHPFERLASAYKERIATLTKDRIQPEPHYDQVRRFICQHHGGFNYAQSPFLRRSSCEDFIPTFEHFVRFILTGSETPIGLARMDGHWKPFTVVCQTCQLQYNFIGKYETFDDDFASLLQRLNVSNWNVQKRRGASGHSRKDYQQLFASLSDELICRLKNLYRDDLQQFNYRIEDYVNRTTLACPS